MPCNPLQEERGGLFSAAALGSTLLVVGSLVVGAIGKAKRGGRNRPVFFSGEGHAVPWAFCCESHSKNLPSSISTFLPTRTIALSSPFPLISPCDE
jgi:hypothetical protein